MADLPLRGADRLAGKRAQSRRCFGLPPVIRRRIRKTKRLGRGRDRLPAKNKPPRLLFEFRRGPRPNLFRRPKSSATDPPRSVKGNVFRRQIRVTKLMDQFDYI